MMNDDKMIEELKKSAMFNLSLSSKELFHSNFIDWLISVDKDAMSEVFSKLLGPEIKISHCKREWNNFDLYIECEGGPSIIIENKFKSIITGQQLDKYDKKAGNSQKVLLSLSSGEHEKNLVNNHPGWRLINYTQLCEELEKLAKNDKYLTNPYHKQLVEDYCCSFRKVSEYFLHKDFSKDTLKKMHEDYGIFQGIGLHDVYQKILFNYLEVKFRKRLDLQNSDLRRVWSGFSRGTGLVSLDYRLKEGHDEPHLELQLQYDHLRLMLIHKEPKKDSLKEFRTEFFEIISDLANSEKYCRTPGELFPKNNKEYNKYGKTLIYKNIKLNENLSFNEIIDLLDDTFKKIVELGKKTDKNI